MLDWAVWRRAFRVYRETLRRVESAQVSARLRNRIYSGIVSRYSWLQKDIASIDDENLWGLLNLSREMEDQLPGDGACADIITSSFKDRKVPQFFFNTEDIAEICDFAHAFYAEEVSDVVRRAERIVQNVFEFDIGERVRFEGDVRWDFRPSGWTEWAVRLNTFYYAPVLCQAYWYTGEEKFANKCIELIHDWVRKNPVGRLPSWKQMAVSQRIVYWAWVYHLLLPLLTTETLSLMLKSLFWHGEFLSSHLEIDQANNHLLLNAVALIVLGTLFPEFKRAEKWRELGLELLQEHLPELICSDGVYAERSSHYQVLVLDYLLRVAILLEENGQVVPAGILKQLQDMTGFLVSLRRPDGGLPMLGDSFAESHMCNVRDTLFAAAFFFDCANWWAMVDRPSLQALWTFGTEAIEDCWERAELQPIEASKAFPAGGYWIMRNVPDQLACQVVVDCGPFGFNRNPAHGHCDALSFEFFYDSWPMVIDPGAYEYGNTKWRNYFRGTSAHSTVVVDGKEQSELWGKSKVGRMANGVCSQWLTTDWFDYFDGYHDGYERLDDPVTHGRQILFAKGENPFLFIWDSLMGEKAHRFDANLHFSPMGEVDELREDSVVLKFGKEHKLVVVPLFSGEVDRSVVSGQTNPPLGWVSYRFGSKHPAPVVSTRATFDCPVSFGYLLLPISCEDRKEKCSTAFRHLDVYDRRGFKKQESAAVQLQTAGGDDSISIVLVNPGNSSSLIEGVNLEASAQLLWAQLTPERELGSLVGINFSAIELNGRSLVQTSSPLSWMWVHQNEATISLQVPASNQADLRLRAPKLVEKVTVNGRRVTHIRDDEFIELGGNR